MNTIQKIKRIKYGKRIKKKEARYYYERELLSKEEYQRRIKEIERGDD